MRLLLTRVCCLPLAALAILVGLSSALDQDREASAIVEEEAGPPAASGSGEAGRGSVEFRVGYYRNGDSGDGNPFLDEKLTVIEPILILDYNITDRLGITTSLSYDYVSSASIDRLSRFPEQSGASGDYYYGGDGAVRYRLSDTARVGGHLGWSREYDYESYAFGGNLALDLANKDATVTASVDGFYDRVDLIRLGVATLRRRIIH